MNYVIKCQRDGWYFKEFKGTYGLPVFGKIHVAKLYSCKADALKEMASMGQYGQRIVALTRMGRKNSTGNKPVPTSIKK